MKSRSFTGKGGQDGTSVEDVGICMELRFHSICIWNELQILWLLNLQVAVVNWYWKMTIGPDSCGSEQDDGDVALIQFSTTKMAAIMAL